MSTSSRMSVPARSACEACAAIGGTWLNLRQCLICGRTGCCDSSPNRHASAHFEESGHPLMRSLEAGPGLVLVLRLQGNAPPGRRGPLAGRRSFFDAGLWFARQQLDGRDVPAVRARRDTTDGFPLGVWETTYRSRHRDGTIDREQAAELEEAARLALVSEPVPESATRPVGAGLCDRCEHARVIESDRGSRFVLCERSRTDPHFPRYPTLPVLRCAGFDSRAAASSTPTRPGSAVPAGHESVGSHLRRSRDGGAANCHGWPATWSMAAHMRTGEADHMAAHVPSLARMTRASSARTGSTGARPRPWLIFLVGGLTIAVAAALIGDEHAIRPALTLSGLAAVLAILAGIRIHRPARRLPWLLLAVCTFLTTIGNVVVQLGADSAFAGQLLTAVGSLAGVFGFALLIRGRIPGGDRAALLDAAILASGTGVVIWAFGFAPYLLAAHQSSIVSGRLLLPGPDRAGDGRPDVVPRRRPSARDARSSCCSSRAPTASSSSTCCTGIIGRGSH